jgi:uncharacterized peroxidase-related enzyme
MARVALVTPGAGNDPTVQAVFEQIERELGFGVVPNVFRAMATQPAVLEANWRLFRATVLQGRLPRTLKEMVGVVVSAAHGSPYARAVHLHSLGMQGVAPETLAALSEGRAEVPGLSRATTAVLRFAQRAAQDPRALSDGEFAALQAAGLEGDEIGEVVSTIVLFTAVNRFTDLAQVPIDGA